MDLKRVLLRLMGDEPLQQLEFKGKLFKLDPQAWEDLRREIEEKERVEQRRQFEEWIRGIQNQQKLQDDIAYQNARNNQERYEQLQNIQRSEYPFWAARKK